MKTWECTLSNPTADGLAAARKVVALRGATIDLVDGAYVLSAPSDLALLCAVQVGHVTRAAPK